MKQLLVLIITLGFIPLVSNPTICLAEGTTFLTVPLKKQKKDHSQVLNPEGHRTPPRKTICLISRENFQSDINPNEIVSYEIWDESDSYCIMTFFNEEPFCQYLFASPDNYCIKISTSDYVYVGFISTLE